MRRLTLFSCLAHLTRLADPRSKEVHEESLRQLTDTLLFVRRADPTWGAELEAWAQQTLGTIARVQAAR